MKPNGPPAALPWRSELASIVYNDGMGRFLRIAVVAFVCHLVSATFAHAQFGSFFSKKRVAPEVSTQEVRQFQADQTTTEAQATATGQPAPLPSFVLVDVRSPEEQAVSIIPGAITAKQFEADRKEYQDRTILVYCTVGYRSNLYALDLIEQGLTAKNYKGSILAWCNAKLPLVTLKGEPTTRVHTYSSRYKVPDTYQAEW